MQSDGTKFYCARCCKHIDCASYKSQAGIEYRNANWNGNCKCIGQIAASTLFLEKILDLSDALVQVLIICGIHDCKAKTASDVIVYTFLHYDEVRNKIDTFPKKRLRKEDLFHDLGRKCRMNRLEAHMAYAIIKRAFKAFYYKDSGSSVSDEGKSSIFECQWVHAAKRTAEINARFEGLSCEDQKSIEAQIKQIYKNYYFRVAKPQSKEKCQCCFCSKAKHYTGGYKVYAAQQPEEIKPADLPTEIEKPDDLDYSCKEKAGMTTEDSNEKLKHFDYSCNKYAKNEDDSTEDPSRCPHCNTPIFHCNDLSKSCADNEKASSPYVVNWVDVTSSTINAATNEESFLNPNLQKDEVPSLIQNETPENNTETIFVDDTHEISSSNHSIEIQGLDEMKDLSEIEQMQKIPSTEQNIDFPKDENVSEVKVNTEEILEKETPEALDNLETQENSA